MSTKPERGGRTYDDPGLREDYLAHRDSGTASPNVVMEEPAFVAAVGSLSGARVADLGCGHGSAADLLMDLGADSYLGLDGSAGMVDLARRRVLRPGVRFARQDIEDVALSPQAFDLVVSRMALHHVEDLAPVFSVIRRALAVDGRFVFTVVHPAITSPVSPPQGPRSTWPVDDYFARGPRERSWFGSRVTWYHRTIEDHIRLLTAAGFGIDHLSECEPDASLLVDDPDELHRRRRVPLILLLAASAR